MAVAPLAVRLAAPGDAEGIRAIYNPEVRESTVTFDMEERSIVDQLSWIEAHSGPYPAIVATETGGEIVGFASLTAYRPRAAYRPTVEDSVYVRRDRRGAGIGLLLLSELLSLAEAHGYHSVIARIVGGHDASIALHARCGFEQIGVEREVGRKLGRWLDVVLMQRMLETARPAR